MFKPFQLNISVLMNNLGTSVVFFSRRSLHIKSLRRLFMFGTNSVYEVMASQRCFLQFPDSIKTAYDSDSVISHAVKGMGIGVELRLTFQFLNISSGYIPIMHPFWTCALVVYRKFNFR